MYQKTFTAQIWPMITIALTEVSSIYNGRVYSVVAPQDTEYPALVYQSQDLGGLSTDKIGAGGMNSWEGIITLRSMSTSQSGAYNLLALAIAELTDDDIIVTNVPTLSGSFRLQFYPDRPIPFPVEKLTEGRLYQAGVLVTVYINPNI